LVLVGREELGELPRILAALVVLAVLLVWPEALEAQMVLEEREAELWLLEELAEPVEPQWDAFRLVAVAVAAEVRLVMAYR
jgi:hypothetical protein